MGKGGRGGGRRRKGGEGGGGREGREGRDGGKGKQGEGKGGRGMEGERRDSLSSTGIMFALRAGFTLQDTAGEERYASLSSFYCRGASVAILAFDLTESQSLERLREVFIPLLEDSVDTCLTVIVGTKLDLVPAEGRQVKVSEGQELAEIQHKKQVERALRSNPNTYLKNVQGKRLYFETSSKSGEGVTELFDHIQRLVLPQLEKASGSYSTKAASQGTKDRSIRLDASNVNEPPPRGGPCCRSN